MTELRLSEDSRASRLLVRLDAGYLQFVSCLRPSLQALACRAATFTGAGGDAPFTGPSAMNPGVTCSPWLFWELVEPLDDEQIVSLALGGTLVVLASVLLDHLSDGQAAHPGETVLLHQALHEAGMARLRACLPGDRGFWRDFERLGAEHVAGLAAELEVQSHPERLTLEAFLAMVPVKFAPIAATMAAFVHALGQPALLSPIEASIKHLAVGSQILDDMGDWEEDLAAGHLTYYLARAVPAEAWPAEKRPPATEVQARIDTDWLDLECMALAQVWLGRSLEAVRGLPCPAWTTYVAGYRALAGEHLVRYKARHLLRAIEPVVQGTGAR